MTKRYGLIGKTLKHSISPQIHACFGVSDYFLKELDPEEVADYLQNGDFLGLNVTIPYKKTVIPFCGSLSSRAQRCHSVNTLARLSDNSLYGHNTDYDGFFYMANRAGIDFAGKKVAILGSGGAGETVRAVAEDCGAGEIVVVSTRAGGVGYGDKERYGDAEILVNATPVGMFPKTDETPVDLKDFSRLGGVLDLIYNPRETRLLAAAAALGIPHANGLWMLIEQARRAEELFQGKEIRQAKNVGIYDTIIY